MVFSEEESGRKDRVGTDELAVIVEDVTFVVEGH
jgi:hypothetical protein